tara:strand:- start:1454 stop:1591 length:138 start_codon:yes stop_codon:yes gene_type:complete
MSITTSDSVSSVIGEKKMTRGGTKKSTRGGKKKKKKSTRGGTRRK